MNVKVSVVIPVYQVEKYLEESLNSVRAQTLKDIEIICVDDGSHDKCPEILDETAKKDIRVRVIHNTNHGYGYSVNTGFRAAAGEYLFILEPDDILPADTLETLYRIAKEQDADLVKGDYYEMKTTADGGKNLTVALLHPDQRLYGQVFDCRQKPAALSSQIINCTGIFRNELIKKYNICLSETPGASFQDISLFFPLMFHSKRIFYTHHITYYYRIDNPNASTKDKGKMLAADREYESAQQYLLSQQAGSEQLSAFWAARWRGALGVLQRIDSTLTDEYLKYIRPVVENADDQGRFRRKYMTAYLWALLLKFRKGNAPFLSSFHCANGSCGQLIRLLWRFRYDGIIKTLRFLQEKKAANTAKQ